MNANCKISKRGEGFVGTITIPGLAPTRLVRSSDGTSVYATRSGVTQSARAIADKLGLECKFDDMATSKSKSKTQKTSKMSSASTQPAEVF